MLERLGRMGPMGRFVIGLLLLAGGIALAFLPGPGFPLVFLGLAFVLSASEPGRRMLKRVRLWARERFGSERVREMEDRLPRDVIGHEDTTQMRMDLVEYEKRKASGRGGRRRRDRSDRG